MSDYWKNAEWTKRVPNWAIWVGGAVVAIGLVLALTLGGGSGSDGDTPQQPAHQADNGGNEGTARIMCKNFVKDRLKSPSTAHFSSTSSSGESPDFSVQGNVDSENGFGAKIRNDYRCLVHYAGNNKWTLTELNGLDQ